MTFVLASQNVKKIRELNEILSDLGIKVISSSDAGFDEDIEETGETFEQNALIKARAVAKYTEMPTIADDSGLCVEALNDAPGIYSARYASEILNATDDDRMNKLLHEMIDKQNRNARFVCAIACVMHTGQEIVVTGECHGEITKEKHGDGGFGYDPIFYVPQFSKTFAEIDAKEKNQISHRGLALKKLCDELKKLNLEEK